MSVHQAVKITAFEAENVKRIKAVQIAPSVTGLTVIGGDNNQGKTSVLDAIAWALGGDRYRPASAQRDGAMTPPRLHLRLSNGLVVERKGKNSSLTVTDPTGRRGGQQILNAFVEQLALDLPKFLQAGDKEKADTLLKIIGVGDQLLQADRAIKSLYDKRTAIGQIADQKKKYADEMQSYPDAPAELVSPTELILRQQEILARNGENQRKRMQTEQLEQRHRALGERLTRLEEELQNVRAEYLQVSEELTTSRKTVQQLQDESTAELENSLRNVEEINRKVRTNLDKDKAEEDALEYAAEYAELTAQITQARRDRLALLQGAQLPLPGLDVRDGRLTYHDKYWSDMSGSDQLRVATAIVRQLNPQCGFVLLDKLEQMDMRTLQEFAAWLEQEGLQAIATRVSVGDECQIIIEDGRVAGADAPETVPVPQKKWTKGAF
ncbi:MAG: AAA family ATPase [Clostridia bacterium]|nr:AAA family ATPase [Clostridia bacterium]